MTAAKDRSLAGLTQCGCCEGIEVTVPGEIWNRPGLKAIAYRIGTHEQFKRSLLARLSSKDFKTLGELTTRRDDDFTIGLLDAWATVADVLTFYQERIANESYLRTATEKLSVRELARLTGYSVNPGVAATAYLAFTLEEAPANTSTGDSTSSTSLALSAAVRQAAAIVPESVTIKAGTKVQSIPGEDEEAQIFETTEAITARPKWNKMRPQLTKQQTIDANSSSSIVVKGTSLQLKAGDRLLLFSASGNALRQIERVTEDATAKTTSIDLVAEASSKPISSIISSAAIAVILAASQSATGSSGSTPTGLVAKAVKQTQAATPMSLAGIYEQIKTSSSGLLGTLTLEAFAIEIQSAYVMRTRASLLGHNAVAWNLLPETTRKQYGSTTAQEWPFTTKSSQQLDLDSVYSQIVPGSLAAVVSGDKTTVTSVTAVRDTAASEFGVSSKVTRLTLDDTIGITSMTALRELVVYAESEKLTLADLPRKDSVDGSSIDLDETVEGLQAGQLFAVGGEIASSGTYSSELVTLQSSAVTNSRTVLTFNSALKNKYKRETVTINANVASASHGETVSETLGSGDATVAFQLLKLKQKPLTYLTDSSETGSASTLKVYVNDVLWKEVENLLDSEPQDHHYVVLTDPEGKTVVQFGDGTNGARLPTGQNNVTATYRKGIGLDGQVKKEKLSLLLTRSYGLKEVANPLDAEGGDDPETLAMARNNAPMKVRTLGRAVSLNDFEDFASAFSGISKALATWTWFGDRRGILLTVAQSQKKTSTAASTSSTLAKKLGEALRKASPPFVRFQIVAYRPVTFYISLKVKVLSQYKEEKVKAAVTKALLDAFSFSKRSFGQAVHLSEVMAVAQSVTGVGGVDVDKLYRAGNEAKLNDRLLAAAANKGADGLFVGAELLSLSSSSLDDVGVMA